MAAWKLTVLFSCNFFKVIKNSVKNAVFIVFLIIFKSYANKYSDATCAYEWQRK